MVSVSVDSSAPLHLKKTKENSPTLWYNNHSYKLEKLSVIKPGRHPYIPHRDQHLNKTCARD